jgi:hypothetical protein
MRRCALHAEETPSRPARGGVEGDSWDTNLCKFWAGSIQIESNNPQLISFLSLRPHASLVAKV